MCLAAVEAAGAATLLQDVGHAAYLPGGSRKTMHDLRVGVAHVSWVGSVLYKSCTVSHSGR